MADVYREVADKVSAVMRIGKKDFNTAFMEVMRNYNLDWKKTKSEIGRILGSRKKGPRIKKAPPEQESFDFAGAYRAMLAQGAREHEQLLTAGIPPHDM